MSTSAEETAVGRPIPAVVDWVVGPLLVVVGLLAGAVGYVLTDFASPAWAEELLAHATVRSSFLTDAERVEVLYNLGLWGGRGLIVTGVIIAVVGIAFLVHRRRVRGHEDVRPDGITTAVLGAVVTAVAMVVPFSPVLGGGVAGYFGGRDRRSGTVHGAYAGVLTAIPVAVLTGFLAWGTIAAGTPVLGLIVLGSVAFSLLYTVGLSAAGGYLGVALTDD